MHPELTRISIAQDKAAIKRWAAVAESAYWRGLQLGLFIGVSVGAVCVITLALSM